MNTLLNSKIDKIIARFPEYKRNRTIELLTLLTTQDNVSGILLGGSCSYKEDVSLSDIDFFCLIHDVERFESNVREHLFMLPDLEQVVNQGRFPWTGVLQTIYYKQDADFSIDVCMIDPKEAENFFWEPNGHIILDKLGKIDEYRKAQQADPAYTKQPFLKSNPFSQSIIALKKIEKNLSRDHLWNAIEQSGILRRYIMQIVRLYVVKDRNFLGRVDRDIEDVIPVDVNFLLSKTIPVYDIEDIAQKTTLLIDLLSNLLGYLHYSGEIAMQNWISAQLQHEKMKLLKHTAHAQA